MRRTFKRRKHNKRGGFSPFKKIKKRFTRKPKTPLPTSPIKEKNPLKRFFSKYKTNDKTHTNSNNMAYIERVGCIVVYNEDQIISILQGSIGENGRVELIKILYTYDDDDANAADTYAQDIVKGFYNINNLTVKEFEDALEDLVKHYS